MGGLAACHYSAQALIFVQACRASSSKFTGYQTSKEIVIGFLMCLNCVLEANIFKTGRDIQLHYCRNGNIHITFINVF